MFERKPFANVFSVEQVFDVVRVHLPDRFDVVKRVSSFPSTGTVNRIRAMLEARRHQGDVNHVVGDVHFLALTLDPDRTVLTIHDCEFMERAGLVKRWIYLWLWLRLPVRRSRIVTVPTDAVAEDLARYVRFSAEKIHVIPDPVSPIFSGETRPFRQDEPVILQVGTRSNKNLERATRALEGLPCRLVVIGPLSRAQRTLLKDCHIRYEAHVDLPQQEVVRHYRDADLVLFASTKEGFGLPVVEAQAMGRPVVTSDRSPMSDVAGGAASLVDPLDVGSIRAGVRRIIEDRAYREKLVGAGLRNVERFSPETVSRAYASVYDEVVASSPRRRR
jgi:glycosyltransferase involved in cell wall biosynthesis